MLGQAYRRSEAPPSPNTLPDAAANPHPPNVALDAAGAAKTVGEVKREIRRGYDMDEARMDTQLEGEEQEVDQCEQGGEELDISFDSQFPDLMSELITEDAHHVTEAPNAAPPASHPSVFPMGVRYMVPPQPSPSSSFLPFPQPLPSASSSGLASITDFSPEWSYPEVTYEALRGLHHPPVCLSAANPHVSWHTRPPGGSIAVDGSFSQQINAVVIFEMMWNPR